MPKAISLRRFLRTAIRREIIRRAVLTALVVGTILAAINHGLEIVTLNVDPTRLLRICLTYVVPYCVSTCSAAMQELRPR
jgi:ABC-type spermidine/putrescine transport system permease subunit II